MQLTVLGIALLEIPPVHAPLVQALDWSIFSESQYFLLYASNCLNYEQNELSNMYDEDILFYKGIEEIKLKKTMKN